jgi:hypothetical protein
MFVAPRHASTNWFPLPVLCAAKLFAAHSNVINLQLAVMQLAWGCERVGNFDDGRV